MTNAGPATLLMLSGGVRSLAVLIDLLENTDDQILTHHVRLSVEDYSNQADLARCQQIIDYCSFNYRPLSLTQSKISCPSLPLYNQILPGIAYEASLAGRTYSDELQVPLERCIMAGEAASNEAPLTQHVRNCFLSGYYSLETPVFERVYLTREQAESAIPERLLQMLDQA